MLKIVRMRYKIFRSRFGRDPGPDDPLFFDSNHDQPVSAGNAEVWSQVMDAAAVTRSDCTSVMRFLGCAETAALDQDRTVRDFALTEKYDSEP